MALNKDFFKRQFLSGTPEEWLIAAGSLAVILLAALQLYAIRKIFSAAGAPVQQAVQSSLIVLGRGAFISMAIAAAAACALSVRRLRAEGFSRKVFYVLVCGVLLWLAPVAQAMLFHATSKMAVSHVLGSRDGLTQRIESAFQDINSAADLKERMSANRAREHFIQTGELIDVLDRHGTTRRFEPSQADTGVRNSLAAVTSVLEQFRATGFLWFCLTPLWLAAGLLLPGARKKISRSAS